MIDIRKLDRYIVKYRKSYFFGIDTRGGLDIRPSPYDAWRTKKLYAAQKVAARIGGHVVRFNPAEGSVI